MDDRPQREKILRDGDASSQFPRRDAAAEPTESQPGIRRCELNSLVGVRHGQVWCLLWHQQHVATIAFVRPTDLLRARESTSIAGALWLGIKTLLPHY